MEAVKRLVQLDKGSIEINVTRRKFTNKPYALTVLDENGKQIVKIRDVYVWSPTNDTYADKLLGSENSNPRSQLTPKILGMLYSHAKNRGLLKGSQCLELCLSSDLQRISPDKVKTPENPWRVFDEKELVPLEVAIRRELNG